MNVLNISKINIDLNKKIMSHEHMLTRKKQKRRFKPVLIRSKRRYILGSK